MKIKNAVILLALCALLVLFFLFTPEKISELGEKISMGKAVISRQNEKPVQKISLQESIKLINAYGKNKGIICMEEDYLTPPADLQGAAAENFEAERKKPSEELLGKVEMELNELWQMQLLPQMDVKLKDMEVQTFVSRRYMDLENDNKYVSLVKLDFFYRDMNLGVSYDILNEKLLACDVSVRLDEEDFADKTDLLKKWSEYLEIGHEEMEKYYIIDTDRNEERAWITIALKNE